MEPPLRPVPAATWPPDPPGVPPEIPGPGWPSPDEPGPLPSQPVPLVPLRTVPPDLATPTEALLRRRTIVVGGPLTDEVAHTAASQVLLLDEDDDAPIDLYLASPDGELAAALLLADTIAVAASRVTVICRAVVGGAALAVLVAADHRIALPHAVFHLRDPASAFHGSVDQVVEGARSLAVQVQDLYERLATATGQSTARVEEDLRSGRMLGAEDARAYGLVHEVVHARRR